jgi:tripartite ATP-independent transporter DctP family solute receptor
MKGKSIILLALLIILMGPCLMAGGQQEAAAEEKAVEMTIATFHPRSGTADVEGLYHFKELVEAQSEGRIVVDVFYGGTLGGERELVEQLKLGTIHLCLGGWGTRGAYIKNVMPWGVPYLFSSKEQILATIDGRIGEEVERLYLENGIVWTGVYFRGNRQLTTNRNVTVPADLQGMKIRLPENPDWLVVWKAFGCLPTPIPSPEIFGSLQTGVVEAQENPVSSNFNRKLWEVQKYTVKTNHIVDIQSYLLSKKFLDSLDAADQELLIQAARDSLQWCTDFSMAKEAELIAEMEENGMEFLTPDLTPFQEVALSTLGYFEDTWEPWVMAETKKVIAK